MMYDQHELKKQLQKLKSGIPVSNSQKSHQHLHACYKSNISNNSRNNTNSGETAKCSKALRWTFPRLASHWQPQPFKNLLGKINHNQFGVEGDTYDQQILNILDYLGYNFHPWFYTASCILPLGFLDIPTINHPVFIREISILSSWLCQKFVRLPGIPGKKCFPVFWHSKILAIWTSFRV